MDGSGSAKISVEKPAQTVKNFSFFWEIFAKLQVVGSHPGLTQPTLGKNKMITSLLNF